MRIMWECNSNACYLDMTDRQEEYSCRVNSLWSASIVTLGNELATCNSSVVSTKESNNSFLWTVEILSVIEPKLFFPIRVPRPYLP
jgi:hypothetical protein